VRRATLSGLDIGQEFLQGRAAEADAKLMAWHKADECSRRLAKIPGIDPIGATLLLLKTPAPEIRNLPK